MGSPCRALWRPLPPCAPRADGLAPAARSPTSVASGDPLGQLVGERGLKHQDLEGVHVLEGEPTRAHHHVAGREPCRRIARGHGTRLVPFEARVEQRREARKMELYAGMLDHLDDEVGRLLQTLDAMQLMENTVVIFQSDNGADYLDFYNHPTLGKFLRSVYNNDDDNMGKPGSFVSYGPAWAQVAMAPYSWFKGHATEGGILAPLIISGPGIKARRTPISAYCNIRDLAPTILKLTGVPYQMNFEGPVLSFSSR